MNFPLSVSPCKEKGRGKNFDLVRNHSLLHITFTVIKAGIGHKHKNKQARILTS